jgi:hypothetical protein
MSRSFEKLLDNNYELVIRRKYEPYTERRLYVVQARKPGLEASAEDESLGKACLVVAREMGVAS